MVVGALRVQGGWYGLAGTGRSRQHYSKDTPVAQLTLYSYGTAMGRDDLIYNM
jgi:hypothetical protein